jgi:drug/metabolite transporter (DMT)-like permease
MSTSHAILFGLGASACWAFANVAVARSARLVGTFRALLWAQVIGGLAFAALAWAFDQRTAAFSAATAAWLLVAGAASLLAYLAMFYAFEHGRLSLAVPLVSGWAVISSAISVLAFHERVRPMQLVGSALVIAGVTLVSQQSGRTAAAEAGAAAAASGVPGSGRHPRWMWAALGAAVGFGVLIPAMGRVAPATGRLGVVWIVFALDILLGLPLAALFRVDLRPPPRAAWTPVVLAGLLEAGGFACIAFTVGRAPMAVVSPLASLASALTVLYAWIVLRDRPPPVALGGAALACAGVVILSL